MLSLLLVTTLLLPQAPQVSAEVDRERIGVGEALTLTVRAVVRTGSAVDVTLPPFDGFALIGRQERRQPVTQDAGNESFILELRLRAQRVGLWTLGPITLALGPIDVTTPEVEVAVEAGTRIPPTLGPRVLDLLERAPPPSSGDVAVTLLVSSDSVIVGEQVDIVTAAWFPRELLGRLRRPPNLQPPSIDGMYTAVQPATAGVAASRMVNGAWYDLYVAHKIAFPVSEGEFTIPPAGLSFSVPAGRQYFSEERAYTLSSRPRTVTVRPVPPGGPGPVARDLALGYELRPEPARAGDPIRIDLVLSGVGNSALWPRPVINWPDGSRGYPEATEDRPMVRSGIVGGLRRFRFVVIADSAGSLALPEVRYDYYDPGRGWRQATARPVVLPVQPAPPLDRQRPAPVLLNREPLGLTALRGWVLGLLLALGILPPLAVVALRLRPRRAAALPPREAGAPERLQAAVRAVVPHPERRREEELVKALREAGFDHAAGEEVARLYYQVAVSRFAPAGWGDADVERRAEQVLARWPRRVRVAALASSLLLLVTLPAGGQASSGDSLYASRRYAAAAALYQQEAARDPASPRRWYAAGAAAWAAGQNASAAAAWLNALRLAPRSPDVRQAWRQVSRLSADLQHAGRVAPITPVELLLLGAMVWTAGWVLIGLRRHRAGLTVLALAGAMAIGAGWLSRDQRLPQAVLARTVRLREAPHGLADESGTADELAVVTLLEQRGGWRLVETPGSARGWVPVTALAEVRGLDSRP